MLLLFSLNSTGQEIRGYYFKDFPVYNLKFLNHLSKFDSVSFNYTFKNLHKYNSQQWPYINFSETDLVERSIPQRSARIYYLLSPDLKTIYIMGVTQNRMFQIKYDTTFQYTWTRPPVGENEFKSEPKCFIPLYQYSLFTSKKDIDVLIGWAEQTLESNLAQKRIILPEDTVSVIGINKLYEISSFDEQKIRSIFYEIPVYSRPLSNISYCLKDSEINKYGKCPKYNTFINNIDVTVKFDIKRDGFSIGIDTAISKLEISYVFIGITFEACDTHGIGETLWIKWADFFKKLNDPIFEQALNCKLNDYFYKQLIGAH